MLLAERFHRGSVGTTRPAVTVSPHSSRGDAVAPVRDTSLAVDVSLCRNLCLPQFLALVRYISVAKPK